MTGRLRHARVVQVAALLAACTPEPTVGAGGATDNETSAEAGPSGGPGGESGESGGTSGTSAGSASGGDGPDFPPPGPPGGDACPDLECLPCGNELSCADPSAAYLGDSCCAEGDALVQMARGLASEAVDVEVRNGLGITCGGFGARVNQYLGPANIEYRGAAGERCQHLAIGPEVDGEVIFWTAHHGDTWVPSPTLATYRLELGVEGDPVEVDRIEDPDVLFEGVHLRDGVLYVAAHEGGVRVYEVGPNGAPTLVDVVTGFDNATKIASDQSALYVADGSGGVRILALDDPLAPAHVAHIEIAGLARDVAVSQGRLVIALGGDGVAAYDVADPSAPVHHGTIDAKGSAQGVDIGDAVIVVAAWSHVGVYDRDSLQLLATERVRPSPEFEQDFGVALEDDFLHVSEWEGHHVLRYHPGLVAPDIWVEEELLAFDPDEPAVKAVVVRNRGYLDLDIEEIAPSDSPAFDVDTYWVRVPPLSGRAFEVTYTPPAAGSERLKLASNDPDEGQNPLWVPLSALPTDRIGVGDTLTDDFAFLSPTGQLDGLRGHVTVLAYFALF